MAFEVLQINGFLFTFQTVCSLFLLVMLPLILNMLITVSLSDQYCTALRFSEVEHCADDTNLFQFGNSPVLLGERITQDLKFLIIEYSYKIGKRGEKISSEVK